MDELTFSGSKKTVEVSKSDPDIVRCSFQKDSYEEAYGTYLLQKISYLLFPGIVPKPIRFQIEDANKQYVMEVERMPHDALHDMSHAKKTNPRIGEKIFNAHEIEFYERRYSAQEPHLWEIGKAFNDAGITIDAARPNWTLAQNAIRHLDTSPPWEKLPNGDVRRTFDEDRLRYSITLLDKKEKNEALQYLNEILDLEQKYTKTV